MAEVTRRIPAVDDLDAQIAAVRGALAGAMLTAAEMPLGVLEPYAQAMAERMVKGYGIRQTEHNDPDALPAPAWITSAFAEQTEPTPQEAASLFEPPPEQKTARVGQAPPIPKKIPKSARAHRR